MAIVKMKRLTLLAMSADKDKIYDALVKSNAVQLKRSQDIPLCRTDDPSVTLERQLERVRRMEEAVNFLSEQTALYNAEHKRGQKAHMPKNSFMRPLTEIDYDYFLNFGSNAQEIEGDVDALFSLRDRLSEAKSARGQNRAEYDRLSLFADLPHPTVWYKNTETTVVQLCQLPQSEWENLVQLAEQYDTVNVEKVCGNSATAVVVALVHKSQTEFLEKAAVCGLVKCSVQTEVLPQLLLKDLSAELTKIDEQTESIRSQIVKFDDKVEEWKIYIDYLSLCAKKIAADGDLQHTSHTFVLEGYYPAESQSAVQTAVEEISDCLILTFDEIGDEEFAPTLTKNNPVVKSFEGITNMYSPPQYHEVDPNPVMSVFYFIIFGFMVADLGYGFLLFTAGLLATVLIKQRTGLKTMLQMFGICGISAMIVGALFGSVFCYSVYSGVFPSPDKYPMVMMIISLALGVVHICAGIGCKMAVKIKRKQTLSAWLADFPWIVTFVSLILAIFNMAMDMADYAPWNNVRLPNVVTQVALYVCLASLAVGIVCAGLGQKGILGKVKSSFGSAYGIINYFSDIMSYIRVFGLMLSSALVGSVVNDISAMLMGGGGVGYVFAAIVLVIAHMFNLAMGVLSVYIHNGRLQYVEFFGKFYTGEGELFVPFGSDTKYTLVKD
ncbi:MAG: V-type ATP synthase subunit I [Corallococcus sp.]|nr:V-type ATP synthase subunit I [Corallococcus sp.]MCM1359388.1 V-type ATP synthase subunit I [Corallococcus sp.]MCM1394831.1 V-type ATP synthase subunit I [Corallococcus sp.]